MADQASMSQSNSSHEKNHQDQQERRLQESAIVEIQESKEGKEPKKQKQKEQEKEQEEKESDKIYKVVTNTDDFWTTRFSPDGFIPDEIADTKTPNFIHACGLDAIQNIIRKFYNGDVSKVQIVELDRKKLEKAGFIIKWESNHEGGQKYWYVHLLHHFVNLISFFCVYRHLYRSSKEMRIPMNCIISARLFQ